MKKLILGFIILFGLRSNSNAQSPVIQEIINKTNLDSLIYFVKELSGEVQTVIGDTSYTIVSRYKFQPGNDKAADYIKQKFENYGLNTIIQSFGSSGENVLATQPGTEFPNVKYIICAHYDDMPPGPVAPGADDNASGTAAVIEAARILSQYSFPITIIFASWDQEELGLLGSAYYAQQAALAGDSILGVINMDMIAWDSDNDGVGEIHVRPIANTYSLKDVMVQVNTTYSIGVDLRTIIPGILSSDQYSFWNHDFGALLLMEELMGGDFNPYYHTINDLLIQYNQLYYHKMSRLAMGTLATLAMTDIVPVEDDLRVINSYSLEQNYPNPFNPTTTIGFGIQNKSNVKITILNAIGEEVAVLLNEEREPGFHQVEFNATNLPSGVYFYQLKADNFIETKKMVLLK